MAADARGLTRHRAGSASSPCRVVSCRQAARLECMPAASPSALDPRSDDLCPHCETRRPARELLEPARGATPAASRWSDPDERERMSERSFVMVKPDARGRGADRRDHLPHRAARAARSSACKKVVMERAVAEEHYGEHRERPFFGELVEFITSGPVVMMAVEGEGAIGALRTMMGPTNPLDAPPGHHPRRLRARGGPERRSTAPTAPSRPPASWRCTSRLELVG